jgi:prolyl-tRNA editing enzyme YbaK/EbsC (Cys-tRNA(Pro) deacylase)
MEINNELPETVQRVAELLKTLGHDKSVVMLHTTGKTSYEAAVALGCSVDAIAKSIVFRRLSDDAAVMVIASGANKIDETKVAKIVGGDIGKANAQFVKENTGYAIGGVCPIGHIKPTLVLIDKGLLELDSVWAAAGHPHAVFNLSPSQLVAMTVAPIVDVALT